MLRLVGATRVRSDSKIFFAGGQEARKRVHLDTATGAPASGTAALRADLDRCYALSGPPESDLIPRYFLPAGRKLGSGCILTLPPERRPPARRRCARIWTDATPCRGHPSPI